VEWRPEIADVKNGVTDTERGCKIGLVNYRCRMSHQTDARTNYVNLYIRYPKATTYLPTDSPTYRISYLPMCFFSYLSGFCTYFLISCFLTTHLTYLLTISLKNHPWKVDSLLSPLTPNGHCSQSLLATRTTCCPSGVRGRNFLPLHYIISRFRF